MGKLEIGGWSEGQFEMDWYVESMGNETLPENGDKREVRKTQIMMGREC